MALRDEQPTVRYDAVRAHTTDPEPRSLMTDSRFCTRCGTALLRAERDGAVRWQCGDSDCGWIAYENPTPVVAAIVELGDDVVLVQNRGWPSTWFGLVSGFLERAEEPEDGIRREIAEELGLTCRTVELVGVYGFEAMNQVIIAYHVVAQGDPVAGEELEAFKRVPIEKLRPWAMGTGRAVSDWLARRKEEDDAKR